MTRRLERVDYNGVRIDVSKSLGSGDDLVAISRWNYWLFLALLGIAVLRTVAFVLDLIVGAS